jgi:hypothetical protein
MVRAKFKVESITENSDNCSIKLSPVTVGSKENEEFYKWTPSGNIELNVLKKETANKFVVGKEYYIDFTEAN